MNKNVIGIVGGTGLGELLLSQGGEPISLTTPFGTPSAPPVRAHWQGADVVFLSRHGEGHRYSPTTVPYRANIFALKALGVTSILASGATGSLREDIVPGHLVVCDQVIDKTSRRESSFFDRGLVAHVELSDPFCARLRRHVLAGSQAAGTTVHSAGTYVCMEGPQFSTRAESFMHRAGGGDLIGMTCMPEAKLAREAEICYSLVAFPTDYDCWRPVPGHIEKTELLREILAHLKEGADRALALIASAVRRMTEAGLEDCPCRHALKLGLWTHKALVPEEEIERLGPLVRRYFPDRIE